MKTKTIIILLRRRLSEIDDALARPVEEGAEWSRRRRDLECERDILVQRIRAAETR